MGEMWFGEATMAFLPLPIFIISWQVNGEQHNSTQIALCRYEHSVHAD